MNAKPISSLLLSLYRICAFAGQREALHAVEARTVPRGGVLKLEKTDGVTHIEVQSGSVWLTGKSGCDVILHSGKEVRLENEWPYVIEALTDAKIALE